METIDNMPDIPDDEFVATIRATMGDPTQRQVLEAYIGPDRLLDWAAHRKLPPQFERKAVVRTIQKMQAGRP